MAQGNSSTHGALLLTFFQYYYKVLIKFYIMILVKLNLNRLHTTSMAKILRSKSCGKKSS